MWAKVWDFVKGLFGGKGATQIGAGNRATTGIHIGERTSNVIFGDGNTIHVAQDASRDREVPVPVLDRTAEEVAQHPKTLRAFLDGKDFDEVMTKETLTTLSELADTLKSIPRNVRVLFSVVIQRAEVDVPYGKVPQVSCREIEEACHIPLSTVRDYVHILEKHRFASFTEDSRSGIWVITLRPLSSGWDVWNDIKDFSHKSGRSLRNIVVELRFDLLD